MAAGLPMSTGTGPDNNAPVAFPVDGAVDSNPNVIEVPTAQKFLLEIEQAEKDMQRYMRRCKKIVKIYTEQIRDETRTDRQYAILWANTEVLKPAVYARAPKPVVSRRFNDQDPVGRALSDVLERSLVSTFERQNIDATMKNVRDDFVLLARGTAWVRYEPKFATMNYGETEPVETLTDESLAYDFVNWSDLIYPRARRWTELPWVGRRVYLDKKAFIERFGEEMYQKCGAKDSGVNPSTRAGDTLGTKQPKDTTCVYEIWSRRDNHVLWLNKNCPEYLDRQPPLYDLHGFFPTPEPAFGTRATDSLTPIPDYIYYQDQAEEINTITDKISGLQDALKLTGFYPAGAEGDISTAIERAAAPSASNQMIPVPAWSSFQAGGGSKQMIEWWPVETVVKVLQGSIQLRKQMIDDVYQITGISDILRGSTVASETATAQEIKAQWGGIRIRDRQQEIARFARDMARISAEIISEKFQPETIWRMTGLKFPTQAEKQQLQQQIEMQKRQQQMMAQQQPQLPAPQGGPMAAPPSVGGGPVAPMADVEIPDEVQRILQSPTQEEIIALMRDDQARSYRIDIETDSTIAPDEQAAQQSATQFTEVIGGMMEKSIPLLQIAPELTELVGESIKLVARTFRGGRQLEDAVEQAVEKIQVKAAKAAKAPPAPNPEIIKAETAAETSKQEMALRERELAFEERKSNEEMGLKKAAHNRQMVDEASAEIDAMTGALIEGGAPSISPLQSVWGDVQRIAVALIQGQQRQADAIAMQGQQMAMLAQALTAPKQVVRGPDGRIVGVEIARTIN